MLRLIALVLGALLLAVLVGALMGPVSQYWKDCAAGYQSGAWCDMAAVLAAATRY